MDGGLIQVQVVNKYAVAEGIVSLELASPEGLPLPSFTPGAHIDVHLANGMIRQYSLCNSSRDTHCYQIAVLLEKNGRGGSRSVHGDISIGDQITIGSPRNHFELTAAEHYVLLAGGIGVTPIFCMADFLAESGKSFQFHYCCRSRRNMAFSDQIAALDLSRYTHLHFDDENPSQKFDAKKVLAAPHAGTHLFVCGPKGFMDYVIASAKACGWDDANIHFEYFSASQPSSDADDAFQLKIASSGQLLPVPSDCTVLEVLLKQGFDIPVSCEQGVCGTCLTPVLEGEPDHRDLFLTSAERAANNKFTPCCSRSKSPILVLDL